MSQIRTMLQSLSDVELFEETIKHFTPAELRTALAERMYSDTSDTFRAYAIEVDLRGTLTINGETRQLSEEEKEIAYDVYHFLGLMQPTV